MGDRTYASIRLGGEIKTIDDLEDIVDAIASYAPRFGQEQIPITGKGSVMSVMRGVLEHGCDPLFHDEEANYGEFDYIQSRAKIVGLGYSVHHESGGGYGAACTTRMPDGEEFWAPTSDSEATVGLGALQRALKDSYPLAAVRQAVMHAEYASGIYLPPLTFSPPVAAYLKINAEPMPAPKVA